MPALRRGVDLLDGSPWEFGRFRLEYVVESRGCEWRDQLTQMRHPRFNLAVMFVTEGAKLGVPMEPEL